MVYSYITLLLPYGQCILTVDCILHIYRVYVYTPIILPCRGVCVSNFITIQNYLKRRRKHRILRPLDFAWISLNIYSISMLRKAYAKGEIHTGQVSDLSCFEAVNAVYARTGKGHGSHPFWGDKIQLAASGMSHRMFCFFLSFHVNSNLLLYGLFETVSLLLCHCTVSTIFLFFCQAL